jgi:hypothetical protein
MSDQKSFLLRLPKPILEAYQKWAEDELRSLNGQLEYVLRKVLKEEGRMPRLDEAKRSKEK